ncbi:HAD-IIIA family hydrolase [Streptomyces sp. NPDC047706]|uniref:HAD-IIIA family hydrolase n=1 Tax=Streptomyces sp. NPDC047706 TaxID=3365486 RepID=UPI0037217DE3
MLLGPGGTGASPRGGWRLREPVRAVLLERDGVLVEDVPGNAGPGRVRPADGAREALAPLRLRGIRTGFLTFRPGIADGRLPEAGVRRVDVRAEELLGPFDVRGVCPHAPADGCHCRPPEPGLILWAAGRVSTAPTDGAVIGDTGAHVEAARRAGARGMLVATARTPPRDTAGQAAPGLRETVRSLVFGRTSLPSAAPVLGRATGRARREGRRRRGPRGAAGRTAGGRRSPPGAGGVRRGR